MPSGGATAIGAAIAAVGAVSLFVAAAVSALRSIKPESSREADDDAMGREAGRLAATGLDAEVSALSENKTDDSLRAPVLELELLWAGAACALALPPCSGALVITSSSLPACSMPPNRSAAAPRAGRAAARGAAAGADHGEGVAVATAGAAAGAAA